VLYSWIDPADPLVWSGIPHNLIASLGRTGVLSDLLDVTPPRRILHLSRNLRARLGRQRLMPPLAPEIRLTTSLSDAWRRRLPSPAVDGWIALGYALGSVRPVRGRVAVFTDVSPHQVSELTRRAPSSDWLSQMTSRDFQLHIRQLARTHRAAYACCVASHWAAASLVQDHDVNPERVHVVGLGHDPGESEPGPRDWSVPRFIFIGRDWHRKNGDAVVRAFLQLRDERPDAELHIVGRHPRLTGDGITTYGELFPHEASQADVMARLRAQGTCFVMPSLIEPFGIAYLEAAARGLPSIATSIGGTPDSVGPGGILVDPSDDHAIFEAMQHMSNPQTAMRYGASAREHARLFTWSKVAGRLLRALDLPIPQSDLPDFIRPPEGGSP